MNFDPLIILWILGGPSLLALCSLPILLLAVILATMLVAYLHHIDIQVMSTTTRAYIYIILGAPYLSVLLFSYFLDILRYLMSTFHIPWTKLFAVEVVGLTLLIFEHYLFSREYMVISLNFEFTSEIITQIGFQERNSPNCESLSLNIKIHAQTTVQTARTRRNGEFRRISKPTSIKDEYVCFSLYFRLIYSPQRKNS